MTKMIEHAEEQHVIEAAYGFRRELLDIEDPVIHFRAEQLARHVKLFELHAIHRNNFSAPPLHFEAVPSRCRTHIQHAFAAKIFWNRKRSDASPERVDADQSRNDRSIGKLQAMVAAMLRQLIDLLLRAAVKLRALRKAGSRHGSVYPAGLLLRRLRNSGCAE